LGRGFLTGAVKRAEEYPEGDFRRNDPRFQGKNFDTNLEIAAMIRKMAAGKKATPAQIALAWLLHKGSNIVPIPGTKRRSYLEENIHSSKIDLSEEDMKQLNDLLPPVTGPRYTEENFKMIDR
jgi:aryl-alcohol dehydrogenase-like predicted oxidoreductase